MTMESEMTTTRHSSRRNAASKVYSWWNNHRRLWDDLDLAQRNGAISPCVCAGCRADPRHRREEQAQSEAEIARIEAEIGKSTEKGDKLYNHPRTRKCFDAPLIPTDAVLAWAPPTPTLSYRSWQGAYSRRAERRDMRRCYGADWWRPVDGD